MESTKDGKFGRRGWLPRFTVRRLMVLTIVVALVLSLTMCVYEVISIDRTRPGYKSVSQTLSESKSPVK
jgi:hypothetical protein